MSVLVDCKGKVNYLSCSDREAIVKFPITEQADINRFGPFVIGYINLAKGEDLAGNLAKFSLLRDAYNNDLIVKIWFKLVHVVNLHDPQEFVPIRKDFPYSYGIHQCTWVVNTVGFGEG